MWAPLAGAALMQIDDFDRRTSDWAREHTPIFGSQHNAEEWSDELRTASVVAHYATIVATPSGDDFGEWLMNKAKGTLVDAAAVAATGAVTQSLKGAVGTNGQFRVEHDLAMLGDAVSHHWGRIFYKVKTPVALDGMYVHNTFVAFGRPDADNGNESRLVDTVVDPQGAHQFLFNVPDDSCCVGSSYDYDYEGGWHCAEWYVDGATQSFRFFYDGTEVGDSYPVCMFMRPSDVLPTLPDTRPPARIGICRPLLRPMRRV